MFSGGRNRLRLAKKGSMMQRGPKVLLVHGRQKVVELLLMSKKTVRSYQLWESGFRIVCQLKLPIISI